jgi:hypothetical protein
MKKKKQQIYCAYDLVKSKTTHEYLLKLTLGINAEDLCSFWESNRKKYLTRANAKKILRLINSILLNKKGETK